MITTPTIRSELTRLANTLAAPRISGNDKIRRAILGALWEADGDDARATAAEISRSIFSLLKSPRPPEVEAVMDELQLLGDIFAEGTSGLDGEVNEEVLRRLRRALGLKASEPLEEAGPGQDLIAQLQAGAPGLSFADVAKVGKTYELVNGDLFEEGYIRITVSAVTQEGHVWGRISDGVGNVVKTPWLDGGEFSADDWKLVEGGEA